MNLRALFLIGTAALALAGCSNAAEDEAKRLGFSSELEMEQVHSKGWHTNAQYRADEGERAKRFGFTDIDELHRADQAGVKTKAQYDKYVADLDASNAEFAREEAAREAREAEGSEPEANRTNVNLDDIKVPRFSAGSYEYKSTQASDYSSCDSSKGNICANAAKWEALCKSANLSQYAAGNFWGGAWMHARNSQAVGHLVENGGTSEIVISWLDTERRTSKKCRLNGVVSGIFKGSQVRENVVKFVTGFSVKDDGTVLIVDTMNDGTI